MPRSGDRGTVEVILEYCFSREEIRMDWLVKRLLQYWGGLVMAWTWRLALHLICLCPRHLSLADTGLPWLSWSHPSQATFPSMSCGKGRVRKHVLCPLEPLSRIPVLIGSGDTFRVLGFFFPFSGTRVFPGGPYIPKTFTLKNSEFYIRNNWFHVSLHDIWSIKIESADIFDCSSFLLK